MVTPPKTDFDRLEDEDKLCPLLTLRRHGFEDEAIILQRYFGGTDFYVPRRPSATDRHVLAIGMDAAEALADELGGISVTIPKGDDARGAVMNAHIALFSMAGIPAWLIAILLGIHVRTVYRSRERWRDQGLMFPRFSSLNPFHNRARKVK